MNNFHSKPKVLAKDPSTPWCRLVSHNLDSLSLVGNKQNLDSLTLVCHKPATSGDVTSPAEGQRSNRDECSAAVTMSAFDQYQTSQLNCAALRTSSSSSPKQGCSYDKTCVGLQERDFTQSTRLLELSHASVSELEESFEQELIYFSEHHEEFGNSTGSVSFSKSNQSIRTQGGEKYGIELESTYETLLAECMCEDVKCCNAIDDSSSVQRDGDLKLDGVRSELATLTPETNISAQKSKTLETDQMYFLNETLTNHSVNLAASSFSDCRNRDVSFSLAEIQSKCQPEYKDNYAKESDICNIVNHFPYKQLSRNSSRPINRLIEENVACLKGSQSKPSINGHPNDNQICNLKPERLEKTEVFSQKMSTSTDLSNIDFQIDYHVKNRPTEHCDSKFSTFDNTQQVSLSWDGIIECRYDKQIDPLPEYQEFFAVSSDPDELTVNRRNIIQVKDTNKTKWLDSDEPSLRIRNRNQLEISNFSHTTDSFVDQIGNSGNKSASIDFCLFENLLNYEMPVVSISNQIPDTKTSNCVTYYTTNDSTVDSVRSLHMEENTAVDDSTFTTIHRENDSLQNSHRSTFCYIDESGGSMKKQKSKIKLSEFSRERSVRFPHKSLDKITREMNTSGADRNTFYDMIRSNWGKMGVDLGNLEGQFQSACFTSLDDGYQSVYRIKKEAANTEAEHTSGVWSNGTTSTRGHLPVGTDLPNMAYGGDTDSDYHTLRQLEKATGQSKQLRIGNLQPILSQSTWQPEINDAPFSASVLDNKTENIHETSIKEDNITTEVNDNSFFCESSALKCNSPIHDLETSDSLPTEVPALGSTGVYEDISRLLGRPTGDLAHQTTGRLNDGFEIMSSSGETKVVPNSEETCCLPTDTIMMDSDPWTVNQITSENNEGNPDSDFLLKLPIIKCQQFSHATTDATENDLSALKPISKEKETNVLLINQTVERVDDEGSRGVVGGSVTVETLASRTTASDQSERLVSTEKTLSSFDPSTRDFVSLNHLKENDESKCHTASPIQVESSANFQKNTTVPEKCRRNYLTEQSTTVGLHQPRSYKSAKTKHKKSPRITYQDRPADLCEKSLYVTGETVVDSDLTDFLEHSHQSLRVTSHGKKGADKKSRKKRSKHHRKSSECRSVKTCEKRQHDVSTMSNESVDLSVSSIECLLEMLIQRGAYPSDLYNKTTHFLIQYYFFD